MRKFATGRIEQSRFSWLGRVLATAVTGGYMTDGKGNPAFDAAQKITMDELEAAQLEDAMAEAKRKKLAEGPAIGSFEKFMGTMRGLK